MALTSKFSWKAGAAGLAALSMLPGAAQADDAGRGVATGAQAPASYAGLGMCDDFEQNEKGVELGAFGSAVQFSEAEDNDIGIVLYTGTGIAPEKVLAGGEKMVENFADEGLAAKCFIGGHDPDKGTRVLFLVNGFLVPETKGLDPSEAVAAIPEVTVEAKMVRQSGMKGDPKYLLSGASYEPTNE